MTYNHNQCVAPSNCTAASQQWTQSTHSCQASTTAANHKAEQTLTDSSGPSTGTATYRCWDGAWQKQSSACGTACAVAPKTWSQVWGQNTKSCTASITAGIHNRQTTVTDSVGTERGTATFQCTNSVWTEVSGSTCEPHCTADTDCAAPKPYCKTSTNKCVACTSSSHCSSPTPNCNTSTNTCESCITCDAGCTGWSPPASNTCSSSTVTQTRSCTNANICGSYSCVTSRTVSGTTDCSCSGCCASDSDCGYWGYCQSTGLCGSCSWEYLAGSCGAEQCVTNDFFGKTIRKTGYRGCSSLFEYCDGGNCNSCGCSFGKCLVNGVSANPGEHGWQSVSCPSTPIHSECSGTQHYTTVGCYGR